MNARRLGGALVLAAVLLLVLAEFQTVFEVTVGSLDVVKRSATGGENHGYAQLVIALAAVALTLLSLRGSRMAAGGVVALGAAALFVALVIDRPDTRGSGTLPESVAYENAQARAGRGYAVELAGGGLLVLAGGLLAAAAGGGGGGGGQRDAAPRRDAGRQGSTSAPRSSRSTAGEP